MLTPCWRECNGESERGDLGADFLLRASEFLLQATEKFLVFASGESEIVVRQGRIFLLQLAFEFELGHSTVRSQPARPLDA